jgi:hypothetical protein
MDQVKFQMVFKKEIRFTNISSLYYYSSPARTATSILTLPETNNAPKDQTSKEEDWKIALLLPLAGCFLDAKLL